MNSLEELDKEELLFFINCYNEYITTFYDTHEEKMQPVCAYEFFDTDFQEILENMLWIREVKRDEICNKRFKNKYYRSLVQQF